VSNLQTIHVYSEIYNVITTHVLPSNYMLNLPQGTISRHIMPH